MRNKTVLISSALLAFSIVIALIAISPVLASNGSLPQFVKTWTCSNNNGFTSAPDPSEYCYQEGCMSESQLLMWSITRPGSSSEYDFEFSIAQGGPYKCEIELITNHFDFRCGDPPYEPQPDEKSEVWFKGVKVGETIDPYCNTAAECGNGNGVCTSPKVECPPSNTCCLPDNCCKLTGATCADYNYCYCQGIGKVLGTTYTYGSGGTTRKYCANVGFQSPGGDLVMQTDAIPHGGLLAIATGKCKDEEPPVTPPSGIKCGPWRPTRKGQTKNCPNMPPGQLYGVVWHDKQTQDRYTSNVICQPLS